MLIRGLVIRDLMLKAIKCRGPKFHAIQVAAQALERFDQVSHDRICCRFGIAMTFVLYPTLRLLSG
jgi:hypothetical protein